MPSANSAAASGGKTMMISSEVIRVFQVNRPIRHTVMPGARIAMIVVMKLTPPMMVPKPCRARPKTQRSPPAPGENEEFDSGV